MRIIYLIILCLLFSVSTACGWGVSLISSGVVADNASSCVASTEMVAMSATDKPTTINDNADNAQHVKNSANIEICQVDILGYLTDTQTSGTVHVEIWSDDSKAGTQYGGDSDATANTHATEGEISFIWSSNAPTGITGDFFMHLVHDSGDRTRWTGYTSSSTYEDSTYDFHLAGADTNDDISFRIHVTE